MLDTDRKERNRKRVMYFAGTVAAVCLLGGIPGVRQAAAQFANQILNNSLFLGHMRSGASTPPTTTNGTLGTGSTDLAGKITAVGTAPPVLTFGVAYTNAPFCTFASGAELEGLSETVTASGITFNGVAAGAIVYYECFGNAGG
jgi:hypothetical protein